MLQIVSNTLQRVPYMRISLDSKQRIIDAFERDEDYVQVAGILGVSRAAAYGIV